MVMLAEEVEPETVFFHVCIPSCSIMTLKSIHLYGSEWKPFGGEHDVVYTEVKL